MHTCKRDRNADSFGNLRISLLAWRGKEIGNDRNLNLCMDNDYICLRDGSVQIPIPELLLITVIFRFNETGFLTLTEHGMREIGGCQLRNFHPHSKETDREQNHSFLFHLVANYRYHTDFFTPHTSVYDVCRRRLYFG